VAAGSMTVAAAAPLPTSTASVNAAQSGNIVQARFHRGGAAVAGLAAGLIGSAVAANAWGGYGYPYGYYGRPYPYYGYYGRPYYHRYYGWHRWHHHYRHW
jgi:hypothetical protein